MTTNPVVLLDLETTHLDIGEAKILELAAIHIDLATLELFSRFHRVVRYPNARDLCSEWSRTTHSENGLLEACADVTPPAQQGIGCGLAEDVQELDEDFSRWLLAIGAGHTRESLVYFGGNNVAAFDIPVLHAQGMEHTLALAHYRTVDVRTLLTVGSAWSGLPVPKAVLTSQHRAMSDCDLALANLRAIRQRFMEGAHVPG